MKNVYTKKNLRDNVYMITEQANPKAGLVNMYLVVGKDESLLFDSGFGVVDNLRLEVEQLTESPVVCVVGHGHPDHVGAAELFDKVYMNEKDDVLLAISLSYERRMDDVFHGNDIDSELYEYAAEHIVDPGGKHFLYENVKEGDIFWVDDESFEAYEIPGHTQGSIALFNREKNYAFISDAVGKRTALVNLPLEKRVGLVAYKEGLERFLNAINEDTLLWSGHSTEPMPHEIMKDMLQACNEVLDGKTESDVVSVSKFAKRKSAASKKMMEHVSGSVILVYDANLL